MWPMMCVEHEHTWFLRFFRFTGLTTQRVLASSQHCFVLDWTKVQVNLLATVDICCPDRTCEWLKMRSERMIKSKRSFDGVRALSSGLTGVPQM